MRLVIKLDYNTFLVCAKDQRNVGEVLNAFGGGLICREEGYGKDRKFVPRDYQPIGVELVADDYVALPDVDGDNPWMRGYKDAQEKLAAAHSELWTLRQEVKKLKGESQ